MRKKTITQAWEKVGRQEPDVCWPWLGKPNASGYGSYGFDGSEQHLAHRVIFKLANPDLPFKLRASEDKNAKQFVLHRCDNTICCNPKHLFLGSLDDNNKDAKSKGRSRGPKLRGPLHHLASLTGEQARQIFNLGAANLAATEIARAYGVSQETARRASRNLHYGGINV